MDAFGDITLPDEAPRSRLCPATPHAHTCGCFTLSLVLLFRAARTLSPFTHLCCVSHEWVSALLSSCQSRGHFSPGFSRGPIVSSAAQPLLQPAPKACPCQSSVPPARLLHPGTRTVLMRFLFSCLPWICASAASHLPLSAGWWLHGPSPPLWPCLQSYRPNFPAVHWSPPGSPQHQAAPIVSITRQGAQHPWETTWCTPAPAARLTRTS